MSEIIIETISKKINTQDEKISQQEKQIQELREEVKSLVDFKEWVQQLSNNTSGLQTAINQMSFPIKEMKELNNNFKAGIKTVHIHHVPKIIWITGGLFVALCLAGAGWYNTYNNLEKYKANDTKYRYLKLNGNKTLQNLLYITDSLYLITQGMRDSVIQREEQQQRDLERLQKAEEMEKEARRLRKISKDK